MKNFELVLLSFASSAIADFVTVESPFPFKKSPFENYAKSVDAIFYEEFQGLTTKLTYVDSSKEKRKNLN